jgi:hypothetical protein
MATMRKERLDREHKERERTRQLLNKNKPTAQIPFIADERERQYNSQFNPMFQKHDKRK